MAFLLDQGGQVGCALLGVKQYGSERGWVTQQRAPLSQHWVPQQVCVVLHACPAHGGTTHWPLMHDGLDAVHLVAQSPQCSGLLFKSTQVPPQHIVPTVQAGQILPASLPASLLPPLEEPLLEPEPELEPLLDPELDEPLLPPLLDPWPPLLDPDPLLLDP
jgi:hypothetical protein